MTESVTMVYDPLLLPVDPAERPIPHCNLIGRMMNDGVTCLGVDAHAVILGHIFTRNHLYHRNFIFINSVLNT